LPDDFILAILGETERNHLPIDLGVVAEILEAGVPGPRARRGIRINLVEVGDDRLDRP
jgi:hypothetical protein